MRLSFMWVWDTTESVCTLCGNHRICFWNRLPSALSGFLFWAETIRESYGSSPRSGLKMTMERLVTVTELCEMLGVSRTRFYDLVRSGILPAPLRNPSNNRPVFNAEMTEACRQVFKTHIGVNGQPYTPNRKRRAANGSAPKRGRHESLIASLSALGMTVTVKQVDEAVKGLPEGLEEGEMVKQVFLRLRQNT